MNTEGRTDKRMHGNALYPSDNGFALVTVLLLVSLLAIIGITVNRSGGMQATLVHNLDQGEEAYYIANAGLKHAFFALSADPSLKNEIFSDMPFGGGSYTVFVTKDVTPMGQVLISSTGKIGTAERTIDKRHFPTNVLYAPLIMDNTITKENQTFNFGNSTYIKIGITSTDKQKRGMITFDISSLPAGIVIKMAMLELYMYNRERTIIGNNVITSVIYSLNGIWTEGVQDGATCTVGATWKTKDCSINWSGTDIDSTVQTTAVVHYDDINTWQMWNITGLVQYWYDNPGTNNGFLIQDEQEIGNQETFIAHFASSEYPDVNLRPKLTVYYREP